MGVIPNAVGRLDDVVEAIRNGDRELAIELLEAEVERLKAKHTANFNEGNRIYKALRSVHWFLIDCERDDKWLKARKACGWNGVDGFEGPVETLPPAKPALRAEELPVGTAMMLGSTKYVLKQAAYNYQEWKNCREAVLELSWISCQELIDRGVEFRLPEEVKNEG